MKTARRTSKGIDAEDTAERRGLFLTLYEKNNCNISDTCKAVPIGRRTYYRWMERSKKFCETVEDINESMIDWAVGQLRKRMDKEDTQAIIFFLKTMGKRRGYAEKQEIMHSGEITTITVVSAVPRVKKDKEK